LDPYAVDDKHTCVGALITAAGSEEVAASYAATYPFALVLVVLASQALASLL